LTSIDLLDGRGYNLTTVVLAVLALVLAVASLYYARRALFPPKRRLTYWVENSSRLLNATDAISGTVQVSRDGVPLSDPYVLVVWIKNTGRYAIASEHFDQRRPLELELQAPIVELTAAIDAEDASVNSYTANGTRISFGPELLAKGRKVTFTALVDGCPDLVVRDYFIDVDVRPARLVPNIDRSSVGLAVLSSAAAVASAVQSLLS
jgi:hypothetical protein